MGNLEQAEKLAGNLPGLLLDAKKLAYGFMKGEHGRRKIGSGEAFWQFRQWQDGDSSKDIDWRRSAKSKDVFVTQREWEAAQTIYLYRDSSASMEFSSSKKLLSKKNYAELILLALSIVLLKGGEKLGLAGTDIPLQAGYNSAKKLAKYLPFQNNEFNCENMLSNSQVIILSDFYYPSEKTTNFCSALASKNIKMLLIQLYDPAEEALDYSGSIDFYDIEGENEEPIFISNIETIKKEYKKNFSNHRLEIEKASVKLGGGFKSISTAVKTEKALLEIYNMLMVK